MEYDAVLIVPKNMKIAVGLSVAGMVVGDKKGRFDDNVYIQTSGVLALFYEAVTDITYVITRNSTYLIRREYEEN